MAQINNSQLSKELIEGAKIQTSFDSIPTQLADKVVPVMEVNPKMLRVVNFCRSSVATNANPTITLPAVDFYLTSFSISRTKNVTSDDSSASLTIFIDGVSRAIAYLAGQTLTAESHSMVVSYNTPIKIDRSSVITFARTLSAAGTTSLNLAIQGYTIEQG